MKKLFTLIVAFFMIAGANAQIEEAVKFKSGNPEWEMAKEGVAWTWPGANFGFPATLSVKGQYCGLRLLDANEQNLTYDLSKGGSHVYTIEFEETPDFYIQMCVNCNVKNQWNGNSAMSYIPLDIKNNVATFTIDASKCIFTGQDNTSKEEYDHVPMNMVELILQAVNADGRTLKIKSISRTIPYPPFVLGVSGGPLTQDMFHEWSGVDANAEIVGNALCAYNLNNSTDIPYGDGNVYYRNYADISKYSKLVITCSEGIFRIMLNRKEHPENKGEYLEYTNDVQNSAITVQNNGDGTKSYSLDIDKIRDEYGYVHLNAIKAPWSQKVTITSMELIPDGKAVDGYRHFSTAYPLDFSTVRDIEAYIVPECEDGKVYMKKVTGVVPANTGLILKDVTGASSVTIPTVNRFDSTLVNLLVPVAEEIEITKAERGNNYLFDGEKWVAVEETTPLNAGSSYLKASSSYSLLEASYKPLSSKNPDFIDGDPSTYDPENGLAPSDKLPGGSIESPVRPENGLVTFPEEDSENADAVGTVTGIDNAQAGKRIARIATVGGAQLSKLQKGVNIVTYSDGSRATVIIK